MARRSRSRGGSSKGEKALAEFIGLLIVGCIVILFRLITNGIRSLDVRVAKGPRQIRAAMSESNMGRNEKSAPRRGKEDSFDQDLDRDHVLDYPQNGRHGMDFDRSSRSED
jgi:hypothetical protein